MIKGFAKFINSIADRNAIRITGKPLTKRILKEPALRDLFGEVKDPSKTMSKLMKNFHCLKQRMSF